MSRERYVIAYLLSVSDNSPYLNLEGDVAAGAEHDAADEETKQHAAAILEAIPYWRLAYEGARVGLLLGHGWLSLGVNRVPIVRSIDLVMEVAGWSLFADDRLLPSVDISFPKSITAITPYTMQRVLAYEYWKTAILPALATYNFLRLLTAAAESRTPEETTAIEAQLCWRLLGQHHRHMSYIFANDVPGQLVLRAVSEHIFMLQRLGNLQETARYLQLRFEFQEAALEVLGSEWRGDLKLGLIGPLSPIPGVHREVGDKALADLARAFANVIRRHVYTLEAHVLETALALPVYSEIAKFKRLNVERVVFTALKNREEVHAADRERIVHRVRDVVSPLTRTTEAKSGFLRKYAHSDDDGCDSHPDFAISQPI